MKVFVILLVLIGIVTFSTIPFIYAPPEPMPDDDFRFSDHVLTGKVISSEVIPDPRKNTPQVTYRDTVVYEIKVIEWHKNPLNNSTITVYGKYFPNDVVPEPMWGIVEFEIGSTVYLYLDETEDGLKFREYASHRVETSENDSKYPVPGGGIISDIYPVKKQFEMGLKFENLKCNEGHVLIQKYDGSPACVTESTKTKLIERGWTSKDSTVFVNECEIGIPPRDDLVFFDCKWVEVPYGWTYENGQWQEDPAILKLGPEPEPSCPEDTVCTCDGKYGFYNKTTNRCDSSPYMPQYYQRNCEQYADLDYEGWTFDAKECDWNQLND